MVAAWVGVAWLVMSFSGDVRAGERTPGLAIEPAKAGTQCVAPPEKMRREHMSMLKHQRDDTVHGGVRGAAASLKGCVECHASTKTQSVAAAPTDFCISCHSYAAVKIDCFECHASRPQGSGFHRLTDAPHSGGAALRRMAEASQRSERRAAPKPDRIPSGDRPAYPTAEGRTW
ncbi:MAG: sulfur reduction protein DsrJ [Pseudomonadota bacterium]